MIDKYRAVHWGLDEGLSQAETYCMIKDVKGFLWIGTRYGLNRFDGNSFKIYFHDAQQKTSIGGDNSTSGIMEDSLHNLWIATEKGISRYDMKADTFTNFKSDISAESVVPFWATKDEVYCWEPQATLTTYNIHSLVRKKLLQLTGNDEVGNGTSMSYSFVDSRTNSIWMLSGKLNVPGGGLMELSLKDGKKQHYEFACSRNIPNHTHDAEGMQYDRKRNALWLNTNDGLMEFTLGDKQFHHVPAFDELMKLKDYNRLVGIALDKKGRVWLATTPKGILIYNPDDGSLNQPFADDPELQFAVSDANACLYIDKDDITWTGSWLRKGVHQVIPYSQVVRYFTADPKKPNSLKSGGIFSSVPAGNGKIWIGTRDGGLNILDTRTDLFSVMNDKDLPGIQTRPFINPVMIDTLNQKAWLVGENGVFKLDMNSNKTEPVIYKNQENQLIPSINALPLSDNKRIVITGVYNNQQGIFKIDTASNTARQLLSFPDNGFDPFFTIPAGDNLIFLKSQSDTLTNKTCTSVNGKWITIPTPIDSIHWSDVSFNETDSTFWVAGNRQIFHLNRQYQIIRRYTSENGVPEFKIFGLTVDKKGNIWFYTDRSIHQLNIETGVITILTEKDGFVKQDFSYFNLAGKDQRGNIYFSGGLFGNGINMVNPDNFISTPSAIYIRSIEVNQKSLSSATGADDFQSLSLKYFQNKISISTGIIDFFSKGKSRIRYKLDNMDTTWQYAPYYYTIRYEGLPPNKYTLLIQASNAANEFTGPIKRLFIQISPAYWNTWWFRIAAVIALVALVYGIIRWRLQAKFRLQLERSEKEREIVDMKQKATELEMQALRAQMNPHFIFNSLNSINRFILQNNKAQASEYLTKFSKLVRLILQNSQASLITLESELESLELYLNLEALRFNYHFDYKISYPNDMDIEVLKVPPLILQPYVENAIWHGLMHKEEKGKLDVEIYEEDDHLYFKITDNGVGRKQSSAMASKSATKHKSMGLRITAHRIAILQHNEGLESPVTIHDLLHADGTAAGTQVSIKMPVIYD